MIRRLTAFRDWACAPEGGAPLALFRMLVGLTTSLAVLGVMNAGLVELLWVDVEYGGYRVFSRVPWLVEVLGGPTVPVMTGLSIATVVGGLLLALGVGGRVTPFLLLQLYMAVDINSHAGGSYDLLLKNALWLCVLCPTTATLSVDAWIWRGSPFRGRPVPAWARAIIAFQIIVVYWTTGLQKVSAHWVPGGEFSALYYILQQPSWQLYDMRFFAWLYPLTQIGTAVTWLWEITAPVWLLALYYRGTRHKGGRLRATFNSWDVRTLYAAVGLFFHGALVLTLNVGIFPMISLAYYLVMWNHDEWASFVGVRRGVPQTPATPAEPAPAPAAPSAG